MMGAVFLIASLAVVLRLARARWDVLTGALAVVAAALGTPVFWALVDGTSAWRGALVLAAAMSVSVSLHVSRGRPFATRAAWTAAALFVTLVCAWGLASGPVTFADFNLVDAWWSSRAGVLATSPVMYLSVIGLLLLWRDDRLLAAAGVAAFVLTTALSAAHATWWQEARPSPPSFLALLPYVVLGLGAFVTIVSQLVARRPFASAIAALSALVIWNVTLMAVAHDGRLRIGEPISYGVVGAEQVRTWHDWVGHLPSAPANVAYALGNDVPLGRYDLFRPSRFLAGEATSATIDVGRDDALFLGGGWHAPEREGDRTFRWATRRAEFTIPLDRALPLVVTLDVRPFEGPSDLPEQTVTLVVNGTRQDTRALERGWHTVSWTVGADAWRGGVTHVELRFARDNKPREFGAADDRPLAAAIDRVSLDYRKPAR